MAKHSSNPWIKIGSYVPQVPSLAYSLRDKISITVSALMAPAVVYAAHHTQGLNSGQCLWMDVIGGTLPLWAVALPIKEGRVLTPRRAHMRNRQLVLQYCNI